MVFSQSIDPTCCCYCTRSVIAVVACGIILGTLRCVGLDVQQRFWDMIGASFRLHPQPLLSRARLVCYIFHPMRLRVFGLVNTDKYHRAPRTQDLQP